MAETPVIAQKLGQVLMYKAGVQISDETMKRLTDAGFIPIMVEDFSELKLMDRAGGAVPVEPMLLAAVSAMADASSGTYASTVRETFVTKLNAVLKQVLLKPQPQTKSQE